MGRTGGRTFQHLTEFADSITECVGCQIPSLFCTPQLGGIVISIEDLTGSDDELIRILNDLGAHVHVRNEDGSCARGSHGRPTGAWSARSLLASATTLRSSIADPRALEILAEYERLDKPGKGALLRREGPVHVVDQRVA